MLDCLHYPRRIAFLRLTDQEMNVVRHGDVAYDYEAITLAHFLEHCQKQIPTLRARQPALPMVATASDEMQVIGAVMALGMVGHTASLLVPTEEKL
jgi:hypothetical protein